jgi:hypothetical protein
MPQNLLTPSVRIPRREALTLELRTDPVKGPTCCSPGDDPLHKSTLGRVRIVGHDTHKRASENAGDAGSSHPLTVVSRFGTATTGTQPGLGVEQSHPEEREWFQWQPKS